MSDIGRLTLVSHAMTEAMAEGRFAADDALTVGGHDRAAAAATTAVGRSVCGPEIRARHTAELLGLAATVDPLLADLDCGRWRGQRLDDIAPAAVARWLSDPVDASHGGESIADLVVRVQGWLAATAEQRTRVIAVTHPAVIRAAVVVALDAPLTSFWRIDVAPLSRTVLHHRDRGWRLRVRAGQD